MKFLWLDLETTGLDPARDAVLSLGMRVTGTDLQTIEEVEWDTRRHVSDLSMDTRVCAMHSASGLLERLPKAPFTWDEIRVLARAFILKHGTGMYLAGSSIHFDKGFLERHAPELLRLVHYRMLDVSVFKVLAEAYAPVLAEPKAEPRHTPLADIEGSIRSFKHYIKCFPDFARYLP